MTKGQLLIAGLFGLLVGWMLRAIYQGDVFSSGDMLAAASTVGVGWWIQRALSRQSELDRVPIEHLSRLCERIEGLVLDCTNVAQGRLGTDGELNRVLRQTSNEVDWLHSLSITLGSDVDKAEVVRTTFWSFKKQLTGQVQPNLRTARSIGMDLRRNCLLLQWHVCKRVLDGPASLE